MGWELDMDIDFPFNISFRIGGSVHIIGFDWLLETLEREVSRGKEILIDEVSGGSAVNDNGGFDSFCTHMKFHRDSYSSLIWKCYEYMVEAMGR